MTFVHASVSTLSVEFDAESLLKVKRAFWGIGGWQESAQENMGHEAGMSFRMNKSHFREPGMSFRISEAFAERTHLRSRNVVENT
jgi:hypothetical protein